MNFKFDLKAETQVYASKTLTAILTAIAFIYTMGKKTGSYYFSNQEVIHEDLSIFFKAVVEGTKTAYRVTKQLGADFRVFHDEHYPTIKERALKLDRYVMDGYGYSVAWVKDLIKF